MLELFADYDAGRLDVDDLASFYCGHLSNKHDVPVSINDAHILLDELLHDRYDSFQEDARAEDEAYEMNEKVNQVYRGEGHRTTDESRPTHRRRNRNLVRAVERLTDD